MSNNDTADEGNRAERLLSPRFAFVKLVTADLERASKFYSEVLSLVPSERFESPHLIELVMRAARDEGFALVLCKYVEGDPPVAGNTVGPIGFDVADADAVLEFAVAAGGTMSRPSLDSGPWRVAFFRDPDGSEIELLSKLQADPAR